MKFLDYGSINIDHVYRLNHLVIPGETQSSFDYKKNAGGKGANQAAALAKAGLSVYMAGKTGKESDFIIKELNEYGVDSSLITISDNPSGHAIIQIDDSAQNGIIIYGGENRNITEAEINKVFEKFEEGDWLVLQNEINMLDLLIQTAKSKKMKICMNLAPFEKALLTLPLEDIDILVVNEIEASGLLGIEPSDDYSKIAMSLIKNFPKNKILMTVGSHGAYWIEANNFIHAPAYEEYPVVDTTAAGDTFIGYFLASIAYCLDPESALQIASKAAALTVSRHGAMQSIPYKEEVFQNEYK